MSDESPESRHERTIASSPVSSSKSSSSNDPYVGRMLGDYQIVRVLGRGGMGSVYVAVHQHLHKTVAIKVLAPHLLDDPRAVERFRREMRSIGRLNSPHVVQALDASLTGEVHYLAMEYVDGLDADELVQRLHGIPVEDACEIVRQVALGLEDARQMELVHRDIKPKNIAISKTGNVKILDLGLALCKSEVLATGRLTAHAAIGSYQYMAPEQFDDSHEVDIRADLYSLGCTLFHLLAGHPPFSGQRYRTLTSLMDAHRKTPIPPVASFNGMVGSELASILDRLLAKRPEDRIQTPGELAQIIAPFAAGSNLASLVAMARESEAMEQSHIATMIGSPTMDSLQGEVKSSPSPRRWQGERGEVSRERRSRTGRYLLIAGVLASLVAGLSLMSVTQYRQQRQTVDRLAASEWSRVVPGLDGGWWMEEYPWLLPPVRAVVAESLQAGSSGIELPFERNSTVESQLVDAFVQWRQSISVHEVTETLNDYAAKAVLHGPPSIRDAFYLIQNDDPESMPSAKLQAMLTKLATNVGKDESVPSCLRDHLLALARHYEGSHDEAEDLYLKAIKEYDQIAGATLLSAVCQADLGELKFSMADFDDAAFRFRLAAAKAQSAGPPALEFDIYAKCREVDSLRRTAERRSQARRVIENVNSLAHRLPEGHPLRAFVMERSAWLNMDEWYVDEAAEQFARAIAIRQKSADAGNLRATVYILLSEHGLAMAERLRGEGEDSQEFLRAHISKLRQAYADQRQYSAKQRQEMAGRLVNSLERLTDVPLFMSNTPESAKDLLQNALEFTSRQSQEDHRMARTEVRVRYKLAIAKALAGDKSANDVRLLAVPTGATWLEDEYRELAKIAVDLDAGSPTALSELAKLIVDVSEDITGRDDIEFVFLAAKVFFRYDASPSERTSQVIDKMAFFAQSIGRRAEDASVLKYLRPQYDVLISESASLESYPREQLAEHIIHSRMPTMVEIPSEAAVFYFTDREGWYVDVRSSKGTLTKLDLGYPMIIAARTSEEARKQVSEKITVEMRQRVLELPESAVFWADPVIDIRKADLPLSLEAPDASPPE